MIDVVGQAISHEKYGGGIVVLQSEHTVTVDFNESHIVKKFQYPEAFGQYLSLGNIRLGENIMAEIQQGKERMEEERETRKANYQEQRAEEQKQLAEQKRATRKKQAESPKGAVAGK